MFGLGLIEMLVMLAIPIVVIAGIVRLEESLANMQDQMARLAENQEFTVKLLSDRK